MFVQHAFDAPSEPLFSSTRIAVLPLNLWRALGLQNLNAIDIQDYAKMRSLVSLQDLAFWAALHDTLTLGSVNVATVPFDGIFPSLSPAHQQEITNSVLPLSRTEDVVRSVHDYLFAPDDTSLSQDVTGVALQSSGATALVVAVPGLGLALQDASLRLTFLRHLLQYCEPLTSSSDVAKLPLFHQFLQLTTSTLG